MMFKVVKLLVVLVLPYTSARRLTAAISFPGLKNEPTELVAFYSKEDKGEYEAMEPILQRLERRLGKRILRFDVGKQRNADLLVCLDDKNQCNSLPYFYNRKTHDFICGGTSTDSFSVPFNTHT